MATRPQTLYRLYEFASRPPNVADPARRRRRPAGGDGPRGDAHTNQRTAPPLASSQGRHIDDITLYWLTNTGVSAARSYWDNKPSYFGPKKFSIPAAFTVFPGEITSPPGAGQSAATRTSPTSTRWARAGISRRGKNRCSSRRRMRAGSGFAASAAVGQGRIDCAKLIEGQVNLEPAEIRRALFFGGNC